MKTTKNLLGLLLIGTLLHPCKKEDLSVDSKNNTGSHNATGSTTKESLLLS